MINKTALGEYFTGLVILAHSIPADLTDANGDNLRDCFIQTLHDAEDELDLGNEVNWDAEGEPADVVAINRNSLASIQAIARDLAMIVEESPFDGGDSDV